MDGDNGAFHNLKRHLSGALLFVAAGSTSAHAEAMTAGVVAEKMSAEDLYTYVAGVVEGLAYSRLQQDGKKTEGMTCIYDWFYKDKDSFGRIEAMFKENPKYPPAAIVAVLAEEKCGG